MTEDGADTSENLVAEVQDIINKPVMETDMAKLASSSGTVERFTPEETIKFILFPMLNGIHDAIRRLAEEVTKLRRQT